MLQVGHRLSRCRFSEAPPSTFVQQPADPRRLRQNHGDHRQDANSIQVPYLLPYRRLTESYFTSWWKPTFADFPTLKLAPIEFGSRRFANRYWVRSNAGSIEDAKNQGGYLLALGNIVQNEPTCGAESDPTLHVDHYRPVCYPGNRSQRIRGGIPRPLVINEKRRVKDGGFVRERCRAHFLHPLGQARQIGQCSFGSQGRKFMQV